MIQEFLTLEVLATFGGLCAAVALIVQFTKSVIKKKFGDSFVRLYAFLIALVLTFLFAGNGPTAQGIVLTVINSILVASAAMGGYELFADPLAKKSK